MHAGQSHQRRGGGRHSISMKHGDALFPSTTRRKSTHNHNHHSHHHHHRRVAMNASDDAVDADSDPAAEVAAIQKRLDKVLDDYENQPEPEPDSPSSTPPPEGMTSFADRQMLMQEELDELLHRLEGHKKNRNRALDDVHASLFKLGQDRQIDPKLLKSLETRSQSRGGGNLLAMRGPSAGADIAGRSLAMADEEKEEKGIDEAFSSANEARGRLSTMHGTLFNFLKMKDMKTAGELEKFKQQVRLLMAEIDHLQESLRLREKKIKRVETRVKDSELQCQDLDILVRRTQREVDTLRPKLETVTTQFEEQKETANKLKTELRQAMITADKAGKEVRKAKREKEVAEHASHQLASKVKQLQASVKLLEGGSSSVSEIVEQVDMLKRQLEAERAAGKERVEAAELAARAKADELANAAWAEKLEAEKERAEKEMHHAAEMMKKAKAAAANAEAAEAAARAKEDKLKRAQSALDDSKAEIKRLHGELMKKPKEIVKEVVVEKVKEVIKRVEVPVEQKVPEAVVERAVKQTLPKATEDILDLLLDEVVVQAATVQIIEEEAYERAQVEIQEAAKASQSRRVSVSDLPPEVAAEFKATKVQVTQLNKTVEQQVVRIESLETEKAQLVDVNNMLQVQYEEVKVEHEKQEQAVEVMRKEHKLMRQATMKMEKEIEQFQAEAKALENKNKELVRKQSEMQIARAASFRPTERGATPITEEEFKPRQKLNVTAVDMYSDMVDAATSPREPDVVHMEVQTDPWQPAGRRSPAHGAGGGGSMHDQHKHEEEGDGTLTGALANWSKARLAKEYQALRRKAWGIRNENVRLLSANNALKAQNHAAVAQYERLQRSQEVNRMIAEALSRFPASRVNDVIPAIASLRATLQHKLAEVRDSARNTIEALRVKLQSMSRDNGELQRALSETQAMFSAGHSQLYPSGMEGAGDGQSVMSGAQSMVQTMHQDSALAEPDGASMTSTPHNGGFGQQHRHRDDTAWLNVGMGRYDPEEQVEYMKEQLQLASNSVLELRGARSQLEEALEYSQLEAEEWKTTAQKLDARIKSHERDAVLYDQLDQEAEFNNAVAILMRESEQLRGAVESGHVSFKYVTRLATTLRSQVVQVLHRVRSRVQRRRQQRVRMPAPLEDGSIALAPSASEGDLARRSSTALSVTSRSSARDSPVSVARRELNNSRKVPPKHHNRSSRRNAAGEDPSTSNKNNSSSQRRSVSPITSGQFLPSLKQQPRQLASSSSSPALRSSAGAAASNGSGTSASTRRREKVQMPRVDAWSPRHEPTSARAGAPVSSRSQMSNLGIDATPRSSTSPAYHSTSLAL